MQPVLNNSAGPSGVLGIIVAKSPATPGEWLICLSTMLILIQIAHWGYRFFKWWRKGFK